MSSEDSREKLAEIIIKIGESPQKKNRQIKGLNFINPITEAATNLMDNHLKDESIVQRYLKDENALRSIFAVEGLLDYVPAGQRAGIETAFRENKPLDEIVDMAALAISGNRLTVRGTSMISLSKVLGDEQSSAYTKFPGLNSSEVYVPQKNKDEIIKSVRRMQTMRSVKIGAGLVGLGLCGILGYMGYCLKDCVSLEVLNPFENGKPVVQYNMPLQKR